MSDPPPERRPQQRADRRTIALVLAAVLALGLLGWSPWTAGFSEAEARTAEGRDAALEAGTDALVAFNTIDYRTIGEVTRSWLAVSTGALAQQVRASRKTLTARTRKDQTRSTAEVLEAAVAAYDQSAGSATVIALVSMTTEERERKPATSRSRFRVALQRIDSVWKVSHLEALAAGR